MNRKKSESRSKFHGKKRTSSTLVCNIGDRVGLSLTVPASTLARRQGAASVTMLRGASESASATRTRSSELSGPIQKKEKKMGMIRATVTAERRPGRAGEANDTRRPTE